jgi:ABC-type sugar transport system substrate-binding protein
MTKTSRRIIVAALAVAGLTIPVSGAAAFEPPSDPQDRFSCVGGVDPVAGHPGFPGIATGLEQASSNSGGVGTAAWSAVFKGNGTIVLC